MNATNQMYTLHPICSVPALNGWAVLFQAQHYALCFNDPKRAVFLPSRGQLYSVRIVQGELDIKQAKPVGDPGAVISLDYCQTSGRLYGTSLIPASTGCIPTLLHQSCAWSADGTLEDPRTYESGTPDMLRFSGGLYKWAGSILSVRNHDQLDHHDTRVEIHTASRQHGYYVLTAGPVGAVSSRHPDASILRGPTGLSWLYRYSAQEHRLEQAHHNGRAVLAGSCAMLPDGSVVVSSNSTRSTVKAYHPPEVLQDVEWREVKPPEPGTPSQPADTPQHWRRLAVRFFEGKDVPAELAGIRSQYLQEPEVTGQCTQCERNALDGRYMKKIKTFYESTPD